MTATGPTRESTLRLLNRVLTTVELVENLRSEAVAFDAETWEELRQAHASLERARRAAEAARERRGWR